MLNYPYALQRPVESMKVENYIFDETINPYSVQVVSPKFKLHERIKVGTHSFTASVLEKVAQGLAISPVDTHIDVVFDHRITLSDLNTFGCPSIDRRLRYKEIAAVKKVRFLSHPPTRVEYVRIDDEAMLEVSFAKLDISRTAYPIKYFTMTSGGSFTFRGYPPLSYVNL